MVILVMVGGGVEEDEAAGRVWEGLARKAYRGVPLGYGIVFFHN